MKIPCRYPGCAALLDKSGYCAKHKSSANTSRRTYDSTRRKTSPELSEAARIRNSARWQRVRRLKLATDPLCEDPLGLHPQTTQTAAHAHHVQPLATHPELAYDLSNLQSVCTRCHARLEAMARKHQKHHPTPPRPPQAPYGPFPGWI